MKDEDYMRRALELSLRGNPSPNPYVGAVIVKDGEIISEGYHHMAGMAHAEVEAMRGADAKGATLYATLEPCSHFGRTPPCTKAIIAAGLAEVVYAVDDPTEKVKGREELEAAGVKVRSGLLAKECERVNEVFFHYSRTGRPFVLLKAAMSADGQIASKTGQSKWVTGDETRKLVHVIRSRYDAILVGINTVLKDDPELTARVVGGRDPLRVILDSMLRTPEDAKVLRDNNVIIATTDGADTSRLEALERKATVWAVGRQEVDLVRLMEKLGKKGVTSVLIEGGATVNYAAVKAGIVDKFMLCMAPKLMLGENTPAFRGEGIEALDNALKLRFESVTKVGDDLVIEAYPFIHG
ncbi:MAG: bifunctional diaminohydroxyphosphoribosylaminopyrimidine deaminase/5-amino-6-(5-phosphoribosylamino)uracil reductase RibD [Candidatus Altiarchaeota archaeon]